MNRTISHRYRLSLSLSLPTWESIHIQRLMPETSYFLVYLFKCIKPSPDVVLGQKRQRAKKKGYERTHQCKCQISTNVSTLGS